MSTSVDKEKAWIVQYPRTFGSMKNLEAFIETGKVHRDRYVRWLPWEEFKAKKRLTLEEALKWFQQARMDYDRIPHRSRFQGDFEENRLYNVLTGEIIPFAVLMS